MKERSEDIGFLLGSMLNFTDHPVRATIDVHRILAERSPIIAGGRAVDATDVDRTDSDRGPNRAPKFNSVLTLT